MGLMQDIGPGPVALDTAIFIYFIEKNPRYVSLLEPLFKAITSGRLPAVTSEVTLLEVLVVPYRAGEEELAARYEEILTRSEHLAMVSLSRDILRLGARIRGVSGQKTPDALQLAAALSTGCTALLTNDRDFGAVKQPRILKLDDYL